MTSNHNNMNKLNPKKIVAVIPCRLDSKRLFGKPMQIIGNYTILELLIQQIKKSKIVKEVVIAISEGVGKEVFIDFCKNKKIKYILGDEEDVVKRLIDGAKIIDAKNLVRITSENPFIFWEGLDRIIEIHIKENNDLTTTIGLPQGSGIEVIKVSALEYTHKFGNKLHRSEYSTLFINENPDKFKIKRIQAPSELHRPKIRLTVDTPEDLILVRKIYKKFGKGKNPISLKKIISFLDKNPSITKINSQIEIKYVRYM